MTTAFTPHAKNHAGLGALASRVVQVQELAWEPIRYPGCFVKTLMVDRQNGLLTVLLKMDPGASLPDQGRQVGPCDCMNGEMNDD